MKIIVEPIGTKHRRLLRIAGYVASHDQPTTADMIRIHFSLSLRGVYRMVATLKDMGVPIRGEPGIGYELRPERLMAWMEETVWGFKPARPTARRFTGEGDRLHA